MTFFIKSTLHCIYLLPTKYYGGEMNINIDKMFSNTTTLRISHWPSLVRVTRPIQHVLSDITAHYLAGYGIVELNCCSFSFLITECIRSVISTVDVNCVEGGVFF